MDVDGGLLPAVASETQKNALSLGKRHHQLKIAPDRFHIGAKRRQLHVIALLKARNIHLPTAQSRCDFLLCDLLGLSQFLKTKLFRDQLSNTLLDLGATGSR